MNENPFKEEDVLWRWEPTEKEKANYVGEEYVAISSTDGRVEILIRWRSGWAGYMGSSVVLAELFRQLLVANEQIAKLKEELDSLRCSLSDEQGANGCLKELNCTLSTEIAKLTARIAELEKHTKALVGYHDVEDFYKEEPAPESAGGGCDHD